MHSIYHVHKENSCLGKEFAFLLLFSCIYAFNCYTLLIVVKYYYIKYRLRQKCLLNFLQKCILQKCIFAKCIFCRFCIFCTFCKYVCFLFYSNVKIHDLQCLFRNNSSVFRHLYLSIVYILSMSMCK